MENNRSWFTLYNKPPILQLIVSLLIIVVSGLVIFSVLLFPATFIFKESFSLGELFSSTFTEYPVGILRYLIVVQDVAIFIIPAIIIIYLLRDNYKHDFHLPEPSKIIFVIFLTFSLLPITYFTGQLNSMMQLPDWLLGIEHWMEQNEESASRVINTLIVSDTPGIMMLNILIIAIIPAIGEEILFRGVFQKIFYRLFSSPHTAIWITACLFSALHFQFFGFLPRFILGLVFGYLYLWSGSLWLPILSHFVNNAVPVVAEYFSSGQNNILSDFDLKTELLVLPFAVLFVMLIMIYFRNSSNRNKG